MRSQEYIQLLRRTVPRPELRGEILSQAAQPSTPKCSHSGLRYALAANLSLVLIACVVCTGVLHFSRSLHQPAASATQDITTPDFSTVIPAEFTKVEAIPLSDEERQFLRDDLLLSLYSTEPHTVVLYQQTLENGDTVYFCAYSLHIDPDFPYPDARDLPEGGIIRSAFCEPFRAAVIRDVIGDRRDHSWIEQYNPAWFYSSGSETETGSWQRLEGTFEYAPDTQLECNVPCTMYSTQMELHGEKTFLLIAACADSENEETVAYLSRIADDAYAALTLTE